MLNAPYIWLLRKELRELFTSRAWWIFFFLLGPLTGVTFISAVNTYSEVSVAGGEAFTPLLGIWAPAFGALEIAAAFLLPFVVIRLASTDRVSGALKLETQHALSAEARLSAKYIALLCGWLLAMLAPMLAIALWRSYGGAIYAPEIFAVAVGHLLNALLTIALGVLAAAVTENPSTAAIVTLAVTVGTWVLTFIAAVHGGMWQRISEYTPTALVAQFQHGLVSAKVVALALEVAAAAYAVAACWLRIGLPLRARVQQTVVIAVLVIAAAAFSVRTSSSYDLSEARLNSFPRVDEQALRTLPKTLSINVHLAPEDPRRQDFERNVVTKLRRTIRHLNLTAESQTSTGLFEQSNSHYGEITYRYDRRDVTTRATTAESALESIYDVTQIPSPPDSAPEFRGHPLQAEPRHARLIFYVLWPVLTAALCWQSLRRL